MRGAEGAGRCNHAIRGMERMMARRMDCRITGSMGGISGGIMARGCGGAMRLLAWRERGMGG
jgi:hypothetical protein